MKRAFIVDFDGTITREDVCVAMAVNYCLPGYSAINKRWQKGEISTQECATEIIDILEITEDQLLKLAYTIEVDNTFQELVDYCRVNQHILWVISDGYDFYIQPILRHHGWDEIPFYSNRLYFKQGKPMVEFPYAQTDCKRCGNCKGTWVQHFKEMGCKVTLIGDGTSDICGAADADDIFAKKSLLKYCKETNVDCQEFSDFAEIVRILKENDVQKKQ